VLRSPCRLFRPRRYGAGLTLKFLAPSTPLALLFGMLLGGICGAILGTLIVRRRGVYFAM